MRLEAHQGSAARPMFHLPALGCRLVAEPAPALCEGGGDDDDAGAPVEFPRLLLKHTDLVVKDHVLHAGVHMHVAYA